MKIIREIEQGSPEWFQSRSFSIGGSGIKKATAKGEGIVRTKYMWKLAYQKITGRTIEEYQDKEMQLGTEVEPISIGTYSLIHDIDVEKVGMVVHSEHKHFSPDALTSCGNGIVESKNGKALVFMEVILKNRVPTGHNKQIQWGLHICEREWCDFIQSHYICDENDNIVAGMPDKPIWVKRVYRDEKLIKTLDEEADKFIEEMLEVVEKIKKG